MKAILATTLFAVKLAFDPPFPNLVHMGTNATAKGSFTIVNPAFFSTADPSCVAFTCLLQLTF